MSINIQAGLHAFVLLCGLATPLTAAPVAPVSTDTISLDGTWSLTVAQPAEAETLSRFFEPGFDDAAFRPIPVPANWSLHGFEEPVYDRVTQGGDGFYRHRFRLPAPLGERRALLHFDGVWASTEVWLNGKNLGRHDSGFTSFAFDVTSDLKDDNLIAVRVRQTNREASLDTNDDWSLPGIYRDVWIEFMPRALWLDRIELETHFDHEFRDADLQIRAFVFRAEPGDRATPGPPFELRAVLTGPDGREVQTQTLTTSVTGGYNGHDVFMKMHVLAPAPWTAETPNLYTLRTDLVRGGSVIHSRSERVGFRSISTAGGVLRINGQAVKLRGVCRHDEHPDTGRATRRAQWEQDLRLMKAANINTVRTSHYPPAEGFLRLCDEMGFYVIDEVPTGYGGERLNDPSYAGNVMQRVRETVTRDRNRPSVVIWSIGNEDPLTALHVDMARAVKGLDPTRPTLMPWRAETDLPPEFDIRAPHYISSEDLDRMAATSDRPIVTTEYTHALGPDDFGGLEDRWRSLTRHPAGAGGTIWLWADQGLMRATAGRKVVEARDLGYPVGTADLVRESDARAGMIYDARGVYGEDGIVNPDRTPERDYWETKAVYAPVTVLDQERPFTAGQGQVSVRLVNEYDFTNLETLGIEWRVMAGERELAKGEARAKAVPHATASLLVPTAAIGTLEPDTAYYVVLRFLAPDGSELAERSVRLRTDAARVAASAGTRPVVTTRADAVEVAVGSSRWTFDPTSGGVKALVAGGRTLLAGARLAVWRTPTISELNVMRVRRRDKGPVPPLDGYTTTVTSWKLVEEDGRVRITAEAEHRVDERNTIGASYVYAIAPDGSLTIDYTLTPSVESPWLPEVGLAFDAPAELSRLRWQGLGPLEATPNKQAATRFGVFSAEASSPSAHGTKAGVEWAEVTDVTGHGVRVSGVPFVRYESGATPTLRALSLVQGSFTKFAGPERSEWRLDTTAGVRFAGHVRIAPASAVP